MSFFLPQGVHCLPTRIGHSAFCATRIPDTAFCPPSPPRLSTASATAPHGALFSTLDVTTFDALRGHRMLSEKLSFFVYFCYIIYSSRLSPCLIFIPSLKTKPPTQESPRKIVMSSKYYFIVFILSIAMVYFIEISFTPFRPDFWSSMELPGKSALGIEPRPVFIFDFLLIQTLLNTQVFFFVIRNALVFFALD